MSKYLNINLILIIFVNIFAIFYQNQVGLFDSSIYQLQMEYARNNYVIYEDFSLLYPPGIYILSNIFIIFEPMISINTLIWIIHFLQNIIIFYLVSNKIEKYKLFVVVYILMETIFFVVVGTEPLSLNFGVIFLLLIYKEKFTHIQLIKLSVLLIIMFLLRWDRAIYIIASLFIYVIYTNHHKLVNSLSITKLFLLSLVSFLISQSIIYFTVGNYSFIDYIYLDALNIHNGRTLSLSFNLLHLIYFILISSYILFLFKFLKKGIKEHQLLFLLIGLHLLPYTFSRPDLSHIVPFFLTSIFFIALLFNKEIKYRLRNMPILVLIAGISVSLLYLNKIDINENTCKFDDTYKSIFVGNDSKSNNAINHPYIYLINSHIKPATRYITDEPGYQNNPNVCKTIISDLEKAQKPLLLIMSTNNTHNFSSSELFSYCENLNSYIESTKVFGKCTIDKNNYKLRVSYDE